MRIFAASIEAPTPAFIAALAALRTQKHIVDLWRERSFADSIQGYDAAFVGVGDYTTPDAMQTKLAIAKACCNLRTAYFLDRSPRGMDQDSDQFWKSGIMGEGRMGALHRAEMLTAMRSNDYKPRIDSLLDQWRMIGPSQCIIPTFHTSMSNDWNPTPWYVVNRANMQKDTPLTITTKDDLNHALIARAFCVQRNRPERGNGIWIPLWAPLAVACSAQRTLYADPLLNGLDYGNPAAFTWKPSEMGRLIDRQADEYSPHESEETSARMLNDIFVGIIKGRE